MKACACGSCQYGPDPKEVPKRAEFLEEVACGIAERHDVNGVVEFRPGWTFLKKVEDGMPENCPIFRAFVAAMEARRIAA